MATLSTCTDWQLGKSLNTSMIHLYQNKLWTDVSFLCMDHQREDAADRIHAHKVVLASRSPVFEAMFYGACADAKSEVELLTTEAAILNLVLRYLYCDETSLELDTAPRVMEVAHMYRITGLVRYCAKFLQSVLQPENACEILEIALFYDQEGLRDAAVQFIDDNASQVLQLDGFLRISHSCLIYILKGDTFYANEADIFKAVEKWAVNKYAADTENIPDGKFTREALGEAFTYLRVPTMSVGDFLSCTKRKGFYTLEETEDILDYMSSEANDIDQVSCHSSIQRMPRLNAESVEDLTYKTTTYESEITSSFLAKVSKDCYIEKFTINELKPFILTAGMDNSLSKEVLVPRYEKNYSGYEISFKNDLKVDLFLKGKLKFPELNFENAFEMRLQDTRLVTLEEPLFLRKKTEPYCFEISLTFDCSYNGVRLQGYSNSTRNAGSCRGYRHSEKCKERVETAARKCKGSVTFTYCCSSEHINSLDNFMVHNLANRENKTHEENNR